MGRSCAEPANVHPDATKPWDEPARQVFGIDTILANGDGLPLNPARGQIDGRGANRAVAKLQGRWTSCRVYIDIPAAWATGSDVAFCLIAETESGHQELTGWIGVDTMGLELSGAATAPRLRGLAFGVDGCPGSGFFLMARSKSNWTGQNATAVLEVFGSEAPFQVLGTPGGNNTTNVAANGIPDKVVPMAGAQLMFFDTSYGKWRPVTSDYQGLKLAPVLLSSQNNWGTAQALTTVAALSEHKNRSGANIFNVIADADNRGSQYVLEALPDPSVAPTDSPSAYVNNDVRNVIKATAGYLIGFTLANTTAGALFFGICNVNAAPGGGQAFVWQVSLAAGQALSVVLPRPRYLSVGIGYAWSTTANVVTLAAGSGTIAADFV